MVSQLLRSLWHLPRRSAIFVVRGYQATLSPDHGPLRVFFPDGCCMYRETCSNYGKRVLQERGLIIGSFLALKRILSCHPWKKLPPEQAMRMFEKQ